MSKLITYIYIPGNYPLPMIAFYNDINIDVWNEEYTTNYGEFSYEFSHLWNIGSYIIYNKEKKEIISYKFNDIYHFIWLLRILKKSMKIKFEFEFVQKNKIFFKQNKKELMRLL